MIKLKAASEFSTIYLVIVVIIAAIVLIALVKPAFILASQKASSNLDTAAQAAKGIIPLLLLRRKVKSKTQVM